MNDDSTREHLTQPHYSEREIGAIWRPKWFLLTRFIAAFGVAIVLVAAEFFLRLNTINYRALWILFTGLVLSNGVFISCYRFRGIWKTHDTTVLTKAVTRFIRMQVNSDLVILTLMLHFSGGATNPFVFYYFFHVILSSILLSKRGAYIEATVAVMLFSTMTLLEGFSMVTHYDLFCQEFRTRPMFIFGTIFALSSALYIAVYMATSIMDSLRHHEAELEKALENQRRLEEEKSRFLDVVAHDLKSPLAAIDTMVSTTLAVHGGTLAPEVKKILERIPKRTSGLIDVIKELLEFSRIERIEEMSRTFEKLALKEIIEPIIEQNRTLANEKSIDITFQKPETLPKILGDRELLDRMAGNLISNAIRYTGEKGSVLITLADKSDRIVFTVKDTGIGIPKEALPMIFNDFFRADNAKKFTSAGTGLGMSIVKTVVHKHGGTITVDSEEGKGSEFTVSLPPAE